MKKLSILLSQIVAGFSTKCAPMYTCEVICKHFNSVPSLSQVTPQLYQHLRTIAPDMIKVGSGKSVLDLWLDFEWFRESEIPEIVEMTKFLVFKDDGYGSDFIRRDVDFKFLFFSYLQKMNGDLSLEFEFHPEMDHPCDNPEMY